MKRDMSARALDIRDGLDHLRLKGSRRFEDIVRIVATTDLTTMRADLWIVYRDGTFEPLADVIGQDRFILGPADGTLIADALNKGLHTIADLRITEQLGGQVAHSYISEQMEAAGYPAEVIAEFTTDFLEKTLGAALEAVRKRAEDLVGPHGFKDSVPNAVTEIGIDLTLRACQEFCRRYECCDKDPELLVAADIPLLVSQMNDIQVGNLRDIAFELSLNDEANKTAAAQVEEKQAADFIKHAQRPETLARVLAPDANIPRATKEQLEQGVADFDTKTSFAYNESHQAGQMRRFVEQAINHDDYNQMEQYGRELLIKDCFALYDAAFSPGQIRIFLNSRLQGYEHIATSIFEEFTEELGKRAEDNATERDGDA